MAHHVTFGDFMAGNFLARDFLGEYLYKYISVQVRFNELSENFLFLKFISSQFCYSSIENFDFHT